MVVERALREGDVHTFLITVAPGQVVTVAADQLGADVSLGIGLNDTAQATADTSDKHHYGPELLLWVAPATGTAQLVVRGLLRLGRLQVRRLQRPPDAIAPLTEVLQTYEALDCPLKWCRRSASSSLRLLTG